MLVLLPIRAALVITTKHYHGDVWGLGGHPVAGAIVIYKDPWYYYHSPLVVTISGGDPA